MKAPDAVIEDLLKSARALLYTSLPDRAWFTQQMRVKIALTLPAAYLDERKVDLSAERYQEIVQGILDTIKKHGRTDLGPHPCSYLHSCVEAHLRHHGDEYYEEGKAIRNRVKLIMPAVEKANLGADLTVPVLSATHHQTAAALAVGKRKSKAPAPVLQDDLFASATPTKKR